MATLYLDPVGGNDANNGTSFANRVKTWTSGITAARVAPGDVVRVIASPAPNSLGNGTWTDNSPTVTLATARTLDIDTCEAAWTPSANVTANFTTGAKQGTNRASIAISSGFTTGLVAYKATGTLDLSTYQQISLWFNSSLAVAAGCFELRLCSDTAGVTAVHTIPLTDQVPGAGLWRVVLKDFATNLNSAIQSVALYAISDPGICTVGLDNIIACKAASDANVLTHLSIIGKNTVGEPEWYGVMGISGTTLTLGCDAVSDVTTTRPYRGTTETVTTYAIQPLDMVNPGALASPPGAAANNQFQDQGTSLSSIVVSGGWDRTAMSTQSGETWLSGSHWATNLLNFAAGGRDYIDTSKMGFAHSVSTPLLLSNTNDGHDIDLIGVVSCGQGILASFQRCGSIKVDHVNGCGTSAINSAGSLTGAKVKVRVRRVMRTIATTAMIPGVSGTGGLHEYWVDRCDNNSGIGLNMSAPCPTRIYGTTFENNVGADVNNGGSNAGADVVFVNCTMNSTSKVVMTGSPVGEILKFHNYGNVANDHRWFNAFYTIATDQTIRHTAAGISWKVSPTSTPEAFPKYPIELPLARRFVTAGVATTLNVWAYRDNSGLTMGIRLRGAEMIGLDDKDYSDETTGSASTWEQLTISITPTASGVVELIGYVWGGTTFNGYFDDVSFT